MNGLDLMECYEELFNYTNGLLEKKEDGEIFSGNFTKCKSSSKNSKYITLTNKASM